MLDMIDVIEVAVPAIDAETLEWEREVYEADPTGGDPVGF